ncbi:zinc metalloproteinase-disintegrin-like 2d [Xenentodon cancila]
MGGRGPAADSAGSRKAASWVGGAQRLTRGARGRQRSGAQHQPEIMLRPLLLWVCIAHSSGLLSHVQRYKVVRPQRCLDRRPRSLQDDPQDDPQDDQSNCRNTVSAGAYSPGEGAGEGAGALSSVRLSSPTAGVSSQEHCFYHGHVEGVADSSVSVGICSGIRGFLRARRQVYLIEPLGQSDEEEHAVYRQEHLKISGRPACGFSNTTMLYDRDGDRDEDRDEDRDRDWDRDQDLGHRPEPAGLFRSRSWKTKNLEEPQRFVELYVVVDNTEYRRYGDETKSRILGAVNHIDKLYRSLNIRIMLVGLEIWSFKDYIDVDLNPETTLDNFLVWRQAELLKRANHDNAQFVTGKDFDGDTVGLANKFAMCTENSGGVNQDHHDNPIGLASTIAHEMGHNFGMSHDAPDCMCGPYHGSGNCVMAEKLRTGAKVFPELFSRCSVQQLAEFMERAQPRCLQQPSSVRTINVGPRCGNALLDPGEECDCGTEEECNNPCCDASTCRLTEGAQCAHGRCCENCQLMASGSVCRKSAGECDLPEYCTGQSQDCPEDDFEMNGKPCYNQASGYCHNGQCPTREQHCWRLFGEGAKNGPDFCYNLNKRGEEGANCGRDKLGFVPCSPPNLKCGSMFCVGGGESITGKRAGYTVFSIECKLPVEDDRTRNIDMVPKGTKCGPDKVCLDNRCVDVSIYGKKEECAKKCNNNGVCNHKNKCHCNPGWAPPHCNVQHKDLPQGQSVIVAAMCAALSALLVITVVIVGLMCCKKNNMDNYKSKVHSAPGKLNPAFQEAGVKDRPQISQPTLMASTATQASSPLVVTVASSRPAPQPPVKMSSVSSASETEPIKPFPPSKPLPPLNKTQYNGAKPSPPPVPPVKPCSPAAARTKPSSPAAAPRTKPSSPAAPRTKPSSPPPRPPVKPKLHRLT